MTIKDFYEQQAQLQRSNTIERYKQLNNSILPGQILFAGSSLAEQFPINEMMQHHTSSHLIYNRGVGGDTITGLLAEKKTLILDLAPSKLFINIGSNDIGGDIYDPEALYARYTDLLDFLTEELAQCKIHVLSYYPVNPKKDCFFDTETQKAMFMNRSNDNIRSMNSRLESYCEANQMTYINVHDILLDTNDELNLSLTVEGIHLWPKAYELILTVLLPYLQA